MSLPVVNILNLESKMYGKTEQIELICYEKFLISYQTLPAYRSFALSFLRKLRTAYVNGHGFDRNVIR